MDCYKLTQESNNPRKITKENFEEDTGKRFPYYIKGWKSKVAVCPACNNPILIIGLYEKGKKPYGKHYARSIPDVATYNPDAYKYCPYAKLRKNIEKSDRKDEVDPIAKKILEILKEQFDRVVYLIRKETGIYFSAKIAKMMLETYMSNEGYRYYYASLSNIPWIFAYMTNSYSLWRQSIYPDSEIKKELEKNPRIKFDGWQVINADEKFLDIHFAFMFHKIFNESSVVKEKITLVVSLIENGQRQLLYEKDIVFEPEKFSNLMQIPDEKGKRDYELLAIAKELIP